MFCRRCGTEFPDDARFCPECGAQSGKEAIPYPAPPVNASRASGNGRALYVLAVVLSVGAFLTALGMCLGQIEFWRDWAGSIERLRRYGLHFEDSRAQLTATIVETTAGVACLAAFAVLCALVKRVRAVFSGIPLAVMALIALKSLTAWIFDLRINGAEYDLSPDAVLTYGLTVVGTALYIVCLAKRREAPALKAAAVVALAGAVGCSLYGCIDDIVFFTQRTWSSFGGFSMLLLGVVFDSMAVCLRAGAMICMVFLDGKKKSPLSTI